MIENNDLLLKVCNIAIQAGEEILKYYNDDIEVTHKGDSSPLTKADLASNKIILNALHELDRTIPILSEESLVEWDQRKSWTTFWLVDPLDGTKEFIKRNGMFTVNIALMSRKKNRWTPLFGVVHAPVTKTTWFGGVISPSERRGPDGTGLMMVNPSSPPLPVRLVASGTHRGEKDELFDQKLGNYDLVRMGSSLKACIGAEGSADLYPRFGPTSCWDIAAAHAVVSGAGGIVVGPSGKNLDYDLVENVLNPYFLVAADNRWTEDWVELQ